MAGTATVEDRILNVEQRLLGFGSVLTELVALRGRTGDLQAYFNQITNDG